MTEASLLRDYPSDHPVERSQAWLSRVLALAGWPASIAVETDPIAPDSYWLTIPEADLGPSVVAELLADHGTALDALQYLANTLLNAHLAKDDQHGYTIELAGYRREQRDRLTGVAQAAIAEVRATGQPVTISHLSPSDRKQLHALIATEPGIASHSEGQEPHRRFIVALALPPEAPELTEQNSTAITKD